MHLVSLARQDVHVADAELHITLEQGETIWTESSSMVPTRRNPAARGTRGVRPAKSVD